MGRKINIILFYEGEQWILAGILLCNANPWRILKSVLGFTGFSLHICRGGDSVLRYSISQCRVLSLRYEKKNCRLVDALTNGGGSWFIFWVICVSKNFSFTWFVISSLKSLWSVSVQDVSKIITTYFYGTVTKIIGMDFFLRGGGLETGELLPVIFFYHFEFVDGIHIKDFEFQWDWFSVIGKISCWIIGITVIGFHLW